MALSIKALWTSVCFISWTASAWGNGDAGYYIYKDSSYFVPWDLEPAFIMGRKRMELMELNSVDAEKSIDSTTLVENIAQQISKQLRLNGNDPQPLPDIMFDVQTASNELGKVWMDAGVLFGMSDLRVIADSEVSDGSLTMISGYIELSRLSASYSVLFNDMGLKTQGQLKVKTRPILLHITLERSSRTSEDVSVSSSFKLSQLADVSIEHKGLESIGESLAVIKSKAGKYIADLVQSSVQKAIQRNLKFIINKRNEKPVKYGSSN